MLAFLQREVVTEWKSPWRIELERRAAEEAVNARILKRKAILRAIVAEAPRPIKTVKKEPAAPGSQKRRMRVARCENKVLSDTPRNIARRVKVTRTCSECERQINPQNRTGKCQVCIYGRERCTCGKVIYKHVQNPSKKCMACFHAETRKTCSIEGCEKLLNASNKNGMCKSHFSKYRRRLKADRKVCSTENCGNFLLKRNTTGLCRKCVDKRWEAARVIKHCDVCGDQIDARSMTNRCRYHQTGTPQNLKRGLLPPVIHMLESTLQ